MVEYLWQYTNGVRQPSPHLLENVFSYNVRFQILCDTQDQKDYLIAMQLMYGRELDIRTWEEWNSRDKQGYMAMDESGTKIEVKQPPLLPIYFCTSVLRHD